MRKNYNICRILSLAVALALCLTVFSFPSPVRGEEQEETLDVIGTPETESVATGRFSRLVSQTAENVAVVTASEIAELNAHTLSDVLAVIPGVHLANNAGPVSVGAVDIQGAEFYHVLLLLDGIPFNNLANSFPDTALIPAQIIERVEVLKGSASSSWGSALGGVINVITKSAESERKAGGGASYSRGERGTQDGRAEVSGTLRRFGYYLSGGHFGWGGFQPNTDARLTNGYGKLTYELPTDGRVTFTVDWLDAYRGEFGPSPVLNAQVSDQVRRALFGLSLVQPLSDRLDLEVSARSSTMRSQIDQDVFDPAFPSEAEVMTREHVSGGSVKLLWRVGDNTLVSGADYDHLRLRQNETLSRLDLLKRDANRWGFYLNDSYSWGPLTVSPGARYDSTGTSGTQWSPSLGATWRVGDNTTVRGYTARGYSLPSFNQDNAEKVWTVQFGAETSAVPYVWLKGTVFRNEVTSLVNSDDVSRMIKRGFEAEGKTTPFFNTSLSAGYTFVDARDRDNDHIVPNIPRHSIILALRYDDQRRVRALATGRQVDWNSAFNGRYGSMLFDFHLNLTPFGPGLYQPQFFFSLHNAFNNAQYFDEIIKNPGRWFEGGVRFQF